MPPFASDSQEKARLYDLDAVAFPVCHFLRRESNKSRKYNPFLCAAGLLWRC